MEGFSVDRDKTFYHNDFLQAYYYTDKLRHLRSYDPELSEIAKALDAKKGFPTSYRISLADDLLVQYDQSGIELKSDCQVFHNIEAIRNESTFTITTGQQIHIGLGPLYVLYKILDTLAIVKECSDMYSERNFVPVFWMASEDHDLEEIRTIPIFGKEFTWKTDQKGAVGRMSTDGISKMFDQIKSEFSLDIAQTEFVEICISAYSEAKNLSQAYRRILHHYFKEFGLIILDADSQKLKSEFSQVLKDELQSKNFQSLEASTLELEESGFSRQLVIRACNLFKLETNSRKRIDGYSLKDLNDYVLNNCYNLSPNAALRPLYQEWILPNLVYVGGPSEIYYWSQLKGIFDNYNVPIPLLHLRTSCVIVPSKSLEVLESLDLQLIYEGEEDIIKMLSAEQALKASKLEVKYSEVIKSLEEYNSLVKEVLNGFNLDTKMSKLGGQLEGLKMLVEANWIQKSAENHKLNKVLKTKEKYFNYEAIQERNEHISTHANVVGLDISSMLSHFGFINSKKTIVFSI